MHMDVLGATGFFLGTVWSRLKLVLSFLLVFGHVASHISPFAVQKVQKLHFRGPELGVA